MNNRLRDIPKSRVFTTGFKLFFGFAVIGLTAALLTGIQSCKPDFVEWSYPPIQCTGDQGLLDSFLGPITVGWKGGIGDHFIYTVLFTFAAVALFVAGFLTAFRDADPRSVAEAARTDVPPVVNPPSTVSYWPALAALSVALMAIGLVANPATFVAGAVSLGVAGLMWTIRTWAEHATADNQVNEEIRERIAFGVEVPVIACIIIGAVAVSLSRVFLSVSSTGAVVLAGVIAAVFFVIGVAYAYIHTLGKNLMAVIAIVAGILVVGAGIVSTAVGERDFEHHEPESGESHGEEDASVDEGSDSTAETETDAPETSAVGSTD
jgi:hypothetical protein